jgi:hypothetical protein
MAISTLTAIRDKVRRLTRSPSISQLPDADLDQYINTFILYDIPNHLRLMDLKTTLTFYTEPYIDTYSTNTVDPLDPLYNFKNRYTTTDQPAYCAGYKLMWSQSREQFYNLYPFVNMVQSIGQTGNGINAHFFGTLSAVPILRNNVTFSSIRSNVGIMMKDDGLGVLEDFFGFTGTIDYITGAYDFIFAAPPGAGQQIFSETVPYQPQRPQALLFFDDAFILRPIPDKVYPINLEVYRLPTELLNIGESPEFEQWWQYIAYGAAKKVFEDRSDPDGVSGIMAEYKTQERLVLRRSIVNMTKERTATIFTEQTGIGMNPNGYNNAY